MEIPPHDARVNIVTFEVLFDGISYLWAPGNDGENLAHMQPIIHINFGGEEFGRGMTAFRRRIVNEPDAFAPEFRQLFLQSNLTVIGENCRLVGVGMIRRELTTAGARRQWRPRGGRGWRRSIERRGSLGSAYSEEWSMWD